MERSRVHLDVIVELLWSHNDESGFNHNVQIRYTDQGHIIVMIEYVCSYCNVRNGIGIQKLWVVHQAKG